VSDHVFIPYEYAPNYPYSATGRLGLTATDHLFDPLTTLAFLAGQVPTPISGTAQHMIATARRFVDEVRPKV
jgi:hypothetical protein